MVIKTISEIVSLKGLSFIPPEIKPILDWAIEFDPKLKSYYDVIYPAQQADS